MKYLKLYESDYDRDHRHRKVYDEIELQIDFSRTWTRLGGLYEGKRVSSRYYAVPIGKYEFEIIVYEHTKGGEQIVVHPDDDLMEDVTGIDRGYRSKRFEIDQIDELADYIYKLEMELI